MPQIFCSVCDTPAPQPVLICLQCPETPTYYCDTRCRDRDRIPHQKNCNNPVRKAIYRAGDLLQSIFYTFREALYDTSVAHVRRNGDVLRIHLNPNPAQVLLHRFPNHLNLSQSDKEQLLSVLSCTDSVAYTCDLSKRLLKDATFGIEETLFCDLRSPFSTLRHHSDGTVDDGETMHSTLTVEAKDGEAYVFDLAGAQNNQFKAVIPFDEYCRRESRDLWKIRQHGYHFKRFEGVVAGEHKLKEQCDPSVYFISGEAQKRMMDAVGRWEAQNGMRIERLLDLDFQSYAECKASLLRKIRADLDGYVAEWEQNGRPLAAWDGIRAKYASLKEFDAKEGTVVPRGSGTRAYRTWSAKYKEGD
ncbi:hypothetical protein PRZ48_007489 [Zasmidium cellare]|uniref:Suppressor of anucleate metulae protein B n=1 Tax=Zasmidium cellare TaxID=395010 RepID=A0ABR0EJJ8_ZASCE|nr:hypothetical protein PRZ48_007489 [Zasmidium cellare]